MKSEQFECIIEGQLAAIRDMIVVKAREYATEDRLHNFRVASVIQDCTMEQALGAFLCKHTVSIYDMINSGEEYSMDKWNEKITDHIVYLLILKAIVTERHDEKVSIGVSDNGAGVFTSREL